MADDDEDKWLYGDAPEESEEKTGEESSANNSLSAPAETPRLRTDSESSLPTLDSKLPEGDKLPEVKELDVTPPGDVVPPGTEESPKIPPAAAQEEEDSDDDSDEDDDVQITIGDIKTGPPAYGPYGSTVLKNTTYRKTNVPPTGSASATSLTTLPAKPDKTLDLEAEGTINGEGVYSFDVESVIEKPWNKPGADITDYFNYGFNEETWNLYSDKQKKLRAENRIEKRISVYHGGVKDGHEAPGSKYMNSHKDVKPYYNKPWQKKPLNEGGTISVIGSISRVESRRRDNDITNPVYSQPPPTMPTMAVSAPSVPVMSPPQPMMMNNIPMEPQRPAPGILHHQGGHHPGGHHLSGPPHHQGGPPHSMAPMGGPPPEVRPPGPPQPSNMPPPMHMNQPPPNMGLLPPRFGGPPPPRGIPPPFHGGPPPGPNYIQAHGPPMNRPPPPFGGNITQHIRPPPPHMGPPPSSIPPQNAGPPPVRPPPVSAPSGPPPPAEPWGSRPPGFYTQQPSTPATPHLATPVTTLIGPSPSPAPSTGTWDRAPAVSGFTSFQDHWSPRRSGSESDISSGSEDGRRSRSRERREYRSRDKDGYEDRERRGRYTKEPSRERERERRHERDRTDRDRDRDKDRDRRSRHGDGERHKRRKERDEERSRSDGHRSSKHKRSKHSHRDSEKDGSTEKEKDRGSSNEPDSSKETVSADTS